jgi:putative protein-disulfide isomerase
VDWVVLSFKKSFRYMQQLIYIHDPMCSWCWAFRPTLSELLRQLPEGIGFSRLLGGLAPDSNAPMPEALRTTLQATWQRIQQKLPETPFNYDFWRANTPRRSTYPACRAVIAAREMDREKEDAMILAIQKAYYLQARNPSDSEILIQLADEIGLEPTSFEQALLNPKTQETLACEITQASQWGVWSFPSLLLQTDIKTWPIAVDYQHAESMLKSIRSIAN